MARPKKRYPAFPDCDIGPLGLSGLADFGGMTRTTAHHAVKAGVYAVKKAPGFKKPYFTHTNSSGTEAQKAWEKYKAEHHPDGRTGRPCKWEASI
jgi:hypothetical protein